MDSMEELIIFLRYFIDVDGNMDQSFAARTFGSGINYTWLGEYNTERNHYETRTPCSMIFAFCEDYYEEYNYCPTVELILMEIEKSDHITMADKKSISELVLEIADVPLKPSEFDYYLEFIKKRYVKYKSIGITQNFIGRLGEDPINALEIAQKELSAIYTSATRTDNINNQVISLRDLADHYKKEFLSEDETKDTGVPYPFPSWNMRLGHMQRGEVIVLAASYNSGKSFIGKEFAYHALNLGYKVVCAELEMQYKQIMERFAARSAMLPINKIKFKKLNEEEKESLSLALDLVSEKEKNNNLMFVPMVESLTPSRLRRAISAYFGKERPDLIVVDYITAMKADSKGGSARWDNVEDILDELKRIAMEYNCVIVTMVHLNKKNETQYQIIDKKADLVLDIMEDIPATPPMGDDWVGTPAILDVEVKRNRSGVKGIAFKLEALYALAHIKENLMTDTQKVVNNANV